jgi:hypothetical protein
MVVAAAHLTWWWVGYALGAAIVVVVAVLVIGIILTAHSIAKVAADATRALEEARDRTEALWRVGETKMAAEEIRDGAVAAREAIRPPPAPGG